MTTVVKLGGTNGSGKTSVARALLEAMDNRHKNPVSGKPTNYFGTINGLRWSVLGSYETVCGGMDTISDKHVRLQIIEREMAHMQNDAVFFEGLITGKTYGAIGALSEVKNHCKWIYAFMDTPFDVCVARVQARRLAAGNTTPFNPQRTMLPTYKAVQSTAKRAVAQGHRVLWLPFAASPSELVQRLINEVEAL